MDRPGRRPERTRSRAHHTRAAGVIAPPTQQEARFAAIVESSQYAIASFDLDGTITSWNRGAEVLVGYEEHEMLGKTILRLFPEAGAARVREVLDGIARGESFDPVGGRVLRADGGEILLSCSVSPMRRGAYGIVGGVVIARDVSREKAVEEALRESEQRFRFLSESSRDVIALYSTVGYPRLEYVSPSVEAMLGYVPADLYADVSGFADIVHPDDLERLLVAGDDGRDAVVRMRRADGSIVHTEVRTELIRDGSGATIGAKSIVRDVSDIFEAHERLAASERRFRALVERSSDVYVLFDEDGTIREVSASIRALVGASPEDLVGRVGWDFVHPDDRERVLADVAAGLTAATPVTIEFRWVRADGSVRWIEEVVSDRRDDPDLQGIVGNLRDVTERRAAEEAAHAHDLRLRMALEAASVASWEIDLETDELTVSDNFGEVFGISRDLAPTTGRALVEVADPDDRPELERVLTMTEPGASAVVELRVTLAGETRVVQGRGGVVVDAAGRRRFLGTGVDLTVQRRAEWERLAVEANYRRTVEASPDAFVATDARGKVVEWTGAAQHTFGWSAEEAIGRSIAELVVPPAMRGRHDDSFSRAVSRREARTTGPVEIVAMHRDGHAFPAEATFLTLPDGDSVRVSAFVRDITDRKAAESNLLKRALTDELTGLANRTLLQDRLHQLLAKVERDGGLVAVLFVDVDRFKVVNDSLGHTVGDELLVQVAARLRGTVRQGDTVARFGGDEFVVACSVATEHDAAAAAHRIAQALTDPFSVAGRSWVVTASIGIALTADAGTLPETLVRDADAAMYCAKERGRARFEMFDEEMRTSAFARLDLESALREAIGDGSINVEYQPVMTLDGTVSGVEALARWDRGDLGVVQPSDFIPLAEETGLIVPLGAHVLDVACAQLAHWRTTRRELADLSLSVNISGRQLLHSDLLAAVVDVLERHRLPAAALCLEITESVLMDDSEAVIASLGSLRSLGVRIAVDDFGTGYSSLLYLRRYPVDSLKLDQFFIAGLGVNAQDDTIVGSLVQLAHALGLTAVAEGVETAEQARLLRSLGCDFGQGFYWSRPQPPDRVEPFLLGRGLPSFAAARGARPSCPADGGGSRPLEVVVVDASADARGQRRSALEASDRFLVVGEARSSTEAILLAELARPDLVLVAAAMLDPGGPDTLAEIHRVAPRARVVLLHAEGPAAATGAGADGVVHHLACSVTDADLVGELLGLGAAPR